VGVFGTGSKGLMVRAQFSLSLQVPLFFATPTKLQVVCPLLQGPAEKPDDF